MLHQVFPCIPLMSGGQRDPLMAFALITKENPCLLEGALDICSDNIGEQRDDADADACRLGATWALILLASIDGQWRQKEASAQKLREAEGYMAAISGESPDKEEAQNMLTYVKESVSGMRTGWF